MKALYVTSIEPHSGKTAFCLGIAKQLQADGHEVGYLKPLSTQPWRTPQGEIADEDAAFVKDMLALETPVVDLAPVVITGDFLRQRLREGAPDDLLEKVERAAQAAAEGKDVLLLEGGASLREGYSVGLSNLAVAQALRAPVLVLVRYHGEMQMLDDALTAQFRLGDQLLGVVLNQVTDEDARKFIQAEAAPFLEGEGVHLLGSLPDVPRLSALSVGELINLLDARVLTRDADAEALVEAFTVGAMTAEAALTRFRRQQNKAVVTGGDRTDIQLAALETSTAALILTGNLRPSPVVLTQAETLGVPVLLVAANTIDTVEAIERAYGKTRLGQPEKLERFMQLMTEYVDLKPVYGALDLD